jgi:N-acetylglutamate synthase-like GNAT family acetyltransferase
MGGKMDFTIRKMKQEDTGAVIEILSKWNMAPLEPTPEIPAPEKTMIDIDNSFVALDGDRIVGVSSYRILYPEIAQTASLSVEPEYRGKHIGHELQVARLKEMKGKGIKKVITETSRPETITWYIKKFGCRVIGKRQKRHPFGYSGTDYYTVLELDLDRYEF